MKPGWERLPIKGLVTNVKTWDPARTRPDGDFTYIDLSAVNQDTKTVVNAKRMSCGEAPSRARQRLATGDILVSTVRPNLNGVAQVPDDLDGATGSTGFCVLRPCAKSLDTGYLFQWVKSPGFIGEMVKRATGQSYPAVSDRIVGESLIPLPPLSEQRRLAGILDRAEALRAKRRAALAVLDALPQAIFLDLFGDPTTNPKGWPIHRLSKVGSLDRGVSTHRPRGAPHLLGGPYPLVQTGEVANCDGYVREFHSTYSETGVKQSKMWPVGTLCITIAANIAKTGILTFPACFPDSIVGFNCADPATTQYVHVWLSFLQKRLEAAAPESAQKNINLGLLRELPIPLPPLPLQQEFARRVAAVEQLRSAERRSLAKLDELFASLQHRAFRGEL